MLFPRPPAVYRRLMRARAGLRRVGAIALALGLPALVASTARAQAVCSFDAATATVQVTLAGGAPATIARDGNAIAVDGAPCGGATVNNTDTIAVTGSGAGLEDDLTLDLSGGSFAPGKTDEGDDDPEIELAMDLPGGGVLRIAGGPGADVLALGTAGANLNADEAVPDVDVTLAGPAAWELAGRQGPDVLRITGGAGTGAPATGVTVDGGTGADLVVAGGGGSDLDGGGGNDTLSYAAASAVRADLSKGTARPAGAAHDVLAGFENLIGSPGADLLVGDGAPNRVEGGGGRDVLDGRRGDDVLKGGKGRDAVDMRDAPSGVTVNLRTGAATGFGRDTLLGIEDVVGTDRADVLIGSEGANELVGRGGPDALRGNAGRDRLVGGLGNDVLEGGPDADTLEGGRGRDQLDGGLGRDTCAPGPDPDAWTACEVVRL